MIELTRVAALDVSAASGLCLIGDGVCVIADDENFLALYGLDGRPRRRVALLPGQLPATHAERKRLKPDFETLVALPDGRLLALGSGSTPARMRGVLVDPARGWQVRVIDLAPLYAALGARLPELNIEGGAVRDDRLLLLQRGNGSARVNACIELALARVLAAIERSGAIEPDAIGGVERVFLGELAGVALSFTDAAVHPDGRLLFSAAAEDTADTYADGVCTGSVLGWLDAGHAVRDAQPLHPTCKIEGIACSAGAGATTALWLVADADDRSIPALLYRAELPGR